jgi:threonine dehydratase
VGSVPSAAALPVTLGEIRAAHEAIRTTLIATPFPPSRTLSAITGARVRIKLENLQFTASFKERGALWKLLSLVPEERKRGVAAMSAGNHAQAVAYHAQQLGIPATIVMPRTTPNVKVEQTQIWGAQVVLEGSTLEEAAVFARGLAAQRDLVFVHPYDDARVIAGQGTVALEMLEVQPDLDMLVVPIGGGGLISGCAIAAKALRPGIEVIGVEAQRYPSMQQALEGKPTDCGGATIAEGIAVKQPGSLTLPVVRSLVDAILTVDERPLEEAVLLLLQIEKTVAEGAGAASLAALLAHRERFAGRSVGLVLSGGNIDPLVLSSILQRGLVRSGRLARLSVDLPDAPGALARVAQCLGEADANIVEVHHQRAFSALPLRSAAVELTLQTRGHDHMNEIVERLRDCGFPARWLDLPPRR